MQNVVSDVLIGAGCLSFREEELHADSRAEARLHVLELLENDTNDALLFRFGLLHTQQKQQQQAQQSVLANPTAIQAGNQKQQRKR